MSKLLHVGLIGFGFSGRVFHAPVLTAVPGLKLDKVVERSSSLSKEHYPWVDVVQHVDAIYEDERIDLVVVATPTHNHFQVAKGALLAGKHVVVEKPFTTTTAEADELIRLAKEQNKLLSVYHNRRWDGDFMTITEMINKQRLGKLISMDLHWDRYNPTIRPNRWREKPILGAGTMYDLGVHFIDQVLCLFGMPLTIKADIRIEREGGISDDFFDVVLGYDDFEVNLRATNLAELPRPRYIIKGTQGTFVKSGIDPQEAALIAGEIPTSPNWGEEPQENWGTLSMDKNGAHSTEQVKTKRGSYSSYYQNIYDSITNGVELVVKPEEARNAIRLIECAFRSHHEQRVIKVSL